MSPTYVVVPAGGGRDFDWESDHVYVKAPTSLTDGAVTVVEDVLKPGFHLARHHHRRMTEIFYVIAGEVTFSFGNGPGKETITADSGSTVTVPPGVSHEVDSPGGARLITVFTPGGFDVYLDECARLSADGVDDPAVATELSEHYDIWAE